jgi:multidrug resistance efflux pump
VQRITPLVGRGYASQAELDAARAKRQDAENRLQLAREKRQTTERNEAANEQIVAVRAPASGVVRMMGAQAGQKVTIGQPIASVATGS